MQLALSYFKNVGGQYDLSELMQLLGLQQNQLDKLIFGLKKDMYIGYENYELRITEKGLLHLISCNQIDSAVENEQYEYKNISISNLKLLNEPYVPKKFLTKF